ncbi:histone H1-like [Magnolia sinica]|uniref:histone H1-like n=1 Tax=Magnolia sinica TaxID=86752 RepID=UPI002657EF20|nr:histone H1-like [Magnolia sinica]
MAKEALPASNKPKPTSEKKTKLTKLPSHPHPPYFQMISEAISSLKDRTGSSQPAIAKYMEEKYKSSLPPNFKKILSVQLKKFTKSEKLMKVKNSYKVSAPDKVKKIVLDSKEKKKEKEVKRVVGVKAEKKKKSSVQLQSVAKRTKRLSQVLTPSALKKRKVATTKKLPKSIKSPKAAARKAVVKKARV